MSCSNRKLVTWALLWPLTFLSLGLARGEAQEQESDTAASQVTFSEAVGSEVRTIIAGTHARLLLESDVSRVAVGRSEVLSYEILTSKELLILGKELGRTSIVVWFADDTTETVMFEVLPDPSYLPDLSLLRSVLIEIHPSIRLDLAADRKAYVLRGLVPDITFSQTAEAAARAYLTSDRVDSGSTRPDSEVDQPEDGEAEEADSPSAGSDGFTQASVINLIRLKSAPMQADQKIRQAIEPLVGSSVTVRRVRLGILPNDAEDLFVLEGGVPDQVTLTRVLFLASRALGAVRRGAGNDIRVLADEAGALTQARNVFGAGAVGGSGGQANRSISAGSVGQQDGSQTLFNRIGSNLGRAKVVEAADGRILSMIQVEHLPLVRVDVRLYEVNLTRLRQWRSELGSLGSNFDQNSLDPSPFAEDIQGPEPEFPDGTGASSIGQDKVQNFLGFLNGGVSNQLQLVTGGLAVDAFFQLLVNEQIARSLSRPSLTVLSGEQAVFGVGGQVPIPVALTLGGGTDQVLNGVDFREFGVQLSVRPLVEELDGETITLDLAPSVTLPDLELTAAIGAASGTGTGTTAFETRGVRTHTRMRDGDAMLIGGLISQRDQKAQGKTPGLGDLPLAGWLFNNESGTSEEFELIIVVNPVIVRPERTDARLWSFIEPPSVLDACLADVGGQPSGEANEDPENSGTPGS